VSKEIIQNYDVDGIHFDDYFYPNPDSSFDSDNYAEYKSGGGTLSLAAWRRENVNILVRDVYSAIKSHNRSLRFGISPQANTDNNLNAQYIDVNTWLSNDGYIDYICPQIYFGFDNGTLPFASTVSMWNSMIKNKSIDLIAGLAPIKLVWWIPGRVPERTSGSIPMIS
jgi:uncharacterized lipoprotein YddW (UPF0748 family)